MHRILILLSLLAGVLCAAPAPLGRMQVLKDQFLPGPELQTRKGDGREPLVLRITAVYPHGTAGFRYDFEWYALEPGAHDLSKYLEPVAGQSVTLPALPVDAVGVLPPGPPGPLPDAGPPELPDVGGYRHWLPIGIAAWIMGGVAIFMAGRKKKAAEQAAAAGPEQTLASRIEPLLRKALTGPLDVSEKASLERLVLAYGRERLGLADAAAGNVWQALRADNATGAWLETLETWLHRPAPVPPAEADLRALLERITATPAA